LAPLQNKSFTGISSATFSYGGNNADQFYVSSAIVSSSPSINPVPLPATAGLLFAGLAGLGFVGRLKRKQTA
jgi:PEP-CTERM motif